MKPRAVDDPCRYLAGVWTLRRRTVDRRTGEVGRVVGEATFQAEPEETGLVWRESGEIRLGAYTGPIAATWLVTGEPGAPAEVRFADGRPFHRLDLHAGDWRVTHGCGSDRYQGRYVVTGSDRWWLCWRVRGPAKDQVVVSSFERRDHPG